MFSHDCEVAGIDSPGGNLTLMFPSDLAWSQLSLLWWKPPAPRRRFATAAWATSAGSGAVDRDRTAHPDVGGPAVAADQFMVLLKGFAFWPQVVGVLPPPSTDERREMIDSVVQLFLARYRSAGH